MANHIAVMPLPSAERAAARQQALADTAAPLSVAPMVRHTRQGTTGQVPA
jgi:hypothetical protein